MHESMQNKFEIEEIKNSIISSRCKHTTFYYTKNAKLYIYGGYGIDNFTKTIKVLNDFYTFDTIEEKFEVISYKGGENMKGKLYQNTYIKSLDKFLFISGDDLSTFFYFKPSTQKFTQHKILFDIPTKREYFTITSMNNDNRVLLLGGCYRSYCYCDCYVLTDTPDFNSIDPQMEINPKNVKKIRKLPLYYQWNRYDLTGRYRGGYSGHQTLVLRNNTFFISGGSENSFDGLNPNAIRHRPRINEKFQILSLESNYFWYNLHIDNKQSYNDNKKRHDISGEKFMNYENINPDNIFVDKKTQESNKKTPTPTTQHVMLYINKNECAERNSKIFIHGGRDSNGKIVDQTYFYQFESSMKGVWLKAESKLELCSHGCSLYHPYKGQTNYYIILSGGIGTYSSTNEITGELITNEIINDQLYYLTELQKFEAIPLKQKTEKDLILNDKEVNNYNHVNEEAMKRYGHCMIEVYLKEKVSSSSKGQQLQKGYLFMIGGYQLYEGFPSSIVMININIENSDSTKDKKKMNYTFNVIDLGPYGYKGRLYPSCAVAFNQIIVYGGICDEEVLDDMFIISIDLQHLNNPLVQKVIYNKNIISQGLSVLNLSGRFGASMVYQPDSENKDKQGKLFVFGGRFNLDPKNVSNSITDQLVIFNLKNNQDMIDVECYIPTIFGFGEKRVKHTACIHDNQMYIWGVKDYFLKLEIPLESFEIDETLVDYLENNRSLGYFDWEEGLERRQDKQWRSKETKEKTQKKEKLYSKIKEEDNVSISNVSLSINETINEKVSLIKNK